jgi:hypothetical protein
VYDSAIKGIPNTQENILRELNSSMVIAPRNPHISYYLDPSHIITMPSNKDRLYIALYARAGAAAMPGGEDE